MAKGIIDGIVPSSDFSFDAAVDPNRILLGRGTELRVCHCLLYSITPTLNEKLLQVLHAKQSTLLLYSILMLFHYLDVVVVILTRFDSARHGSFVGRPKSIHKN